MGPAARHAALVAALREGEAGSPAVLDAFARVPRHPFLPGVELERVYRDDAVVTRTEAGEPTSSSSQPSLMARMLTQLEVRPGDRVLEIGTGTGWNAALLAAMGAEVTSMDLQPEVAEAARACLAQAAPGPGSVEVVAGDGAAAPPGPYDGVIVTAACWELPARLLDGLAEDGVLVAPLRFTPVEACVALRRSGGELHGRGAIPCGFMPLRGGVGGPFRWELGTGGLATADADLGTEGRGSLDRLLAAPGREVADPLGLADEERLRDALLWLGLQGDPLVGMLRGGTDRPRWSLALHVLPASALVLHPSEGFDRVAAAELHGGEGALRACSTAVAAWRAAGTPGTRELELTVAPHAGRGGASLPWPTPDGATALIRGAHRWTVRYGSSRLSPQKDA